MHYAGRLVTAWDHRRTLVWVVIYGVFRCVGAVFRLVLKLIGSAYGPIGAVGGEDARTLVPGHTNVLLGARDRIRRCGPTKRWLKVEQGTWGPNAMNISA